MMVSIATPKLNVYRYFQTIPGGFIASFVLAHSPREARHKAFLQSRASNRSIGIPPKYFCTANLATINDLGITLDKADILRLVQDSLLTLAHEKGQHALKLHYYHAVLTRKLHFLKDKPC